MLFFANKLSSDLLFLFTSVFFSMGPNGSQIEQKSFIWAKAKSAQREGQELSNKAPHKLLALLGHEFHEKICKKKSYVLSKITVWTASFFMAVMFTCVKKTKM